MFWLTGGQDWSRDNMVTLLELRSGMSVRETQHRHGRRRGSVCVCMCVCMCACVHAFVYVCDLPNALVKLWNSSVGMRGSGSSLK